jgi:hypothetical protein
MVRKKMPAKVIKRRVFFTLFPRKSEKKMGRSNSRTVAPAKSNASLSGIGNRERFIDKGSSGSIFSAVEHSIDRAVPRVSPILENKSL